VVAVDDPELVEIVGVVGMVVVGAPAGGVAIVVVEPTGPFVPPPPVGAAVGLGIAPVLASGVGVGVPLASVPAVISPSAAGPVVGGSSIAAPAGAVSPVRASNPTVATRSPPPPPIPPGDAPPADSPGTGAGGGLAPDGGGSHAAANSAATTHATHATNVRERPAPRASCRAPAT